MGDENGNCSCTPEENDVIATTTGLAFPANSAVDVCMGRLLIDKELPFDVNLDLKIDVVDVQLVENSPYFAFNPNASSMCPSSGCGRVDVNGDGKVNQLDSTSITQSAELGTNVTCGGVTATAFSCGSTSKAPITPAVAISLDTVVYFSDDGLIVEGIALEHDNDRRRRATRDILVDGLMMEIGQLKEDLTPRDGSEARGASVAARR